MVAFTQAHSSGKGQLYFSGSIVGGTDKAVKVETESGCLWFPRAVLKWKNDQYIVAPWFKYNDYQFKIIKKISGFVVV